MDHHIQRCLPKVLWSPNTWPMYGTYPTWTVNIIVCGRIISAYQVIRSMPWAGHRRKSTFRHWPRLGKTRMWGMPMDSVNFRSETAGHFFWPNPSADECSNPRAICRNASTANHPRFKLMFIVRNKHRIIHKFTYFNVDGFLISFVLCWYNFNIVKLSIKFLMVFSNYDSSLLKLRRYMNGTAPSLCILSLWLWINVFRVACWVLVWMFWFEL